jgi:hypothetical protein
MDHQLSLPLEPGFELESPLKRAWYRTRMRVPYEKAIRVPALAICLRNIAAAEKRRAIRQAVRARLRESSRERLMEGLN